MTSEEMCRTLLARRRQLCRWMPLLCWPCLQAARDEIVEIDEVLKSLDERRVLRISVEMDLAGESALALADALEGVAKAIRQGARA